MDIYNLANKEYEISILRNSMSYMKTQKENSINLEKQYTNKMRSSTKRNYKKELNRNLELRIQWME